MEDTFKDEMLYTPEEESDINLSTQRSIWTTSTDSPILALHNKYKRGKLNIQPIYQRNYVWDAKKASLLIESILLGIPIPVIYLAENDKKEANVIDGQQRLTSMFSFIDGVFPNGRPFKLTGMNVFTELKGKTFSNLDEKLQEKILDYPVRVITFTADSDPDLQYEIFTRLNTGSVALNDQELRNCIYRGRFNEMLKDLAKNEDFMALLGLSSPHKRMKDVELVLRFISFYTQSYLNYTTPIKKFLNDTMRRNKDIQDIDEKKLREAFKRASHNTRTLLGNKAFKRLSMGDENNPDGHWEDNINVALYDVTMDSMARIETPVLMKHLDTVREAYLNLLTTDTEFINSIRIGTSDKPVVTLRFNKWNSVLLPIIADTKPEKRCFSRAVKETLYGQSQTCAICGQHIADIDDSAVDHIEQYWMGGATELENARLVHRYCNCARSKFDKGD